MIWDIAFAKRLQHGSTAFELDVDVRSPAPRLVLFGPSGAGKTQTLKVLAGLVRPDRGHVAIAGTTLYDSDLAIDLSPQRRRLAYVFQDYALFPHLTVRQNIAFARRSGPLNPSRAYSDERVERWVETFDLHGVVDHYPHQVSGGQRQRTALARSLMNQPAALLLDEPFAALDQALRRSLRDDLCAVQRELGIPMLLITHDEDDVRALADEVVHMASGRVVDRAPRPMGA